ncbi:MAG TPA: NAD-dependent epimerase/dehydratase family protein [Deinococcales bacterium]|nr:NAD-dependent epimerase/dehydratase family protein [Deinococcales bacterium]
MRLLVIGGTVFLGRHVVQVALERGHEVVMFNRGRHGAELFPGVERITGDRTTDLGKLAGRSFDAVVDTCGYVPRVVRQSAEALRDSAGHYTFVSSVSVYSDLAARGVAEDAPVGRLEDETVEEVTGPTYGPLKALCEDVTREVFGERALVVRPGLIVGPHDPSDRFTYWPERAWRGGEVLAPDRPERGAQMIDVRDLAEWMVSASERKLAGTYNAVRPGGSLDFGTMLDTCIAVAREAGAPESSVTMVDDAFLLEQGVGPWMELPLWIPLSDPMSEGMNHVSPERAVREGMTFRPFRETAEATLQWAITLPQDRQRRAGLGAEKERQVLDAWKARA